MQVPQRRSVGFTAILGDKEATRQNARPSPRTHPSHSLYLSDVDGSQVDLRHGSDRATTTPTGSSLGLLKLPKHGRASLSSNYLELSSTSSPQTLSIHAGKRRGQVLVPNISSP
jgi:hypothetical protein